MVAGNITISPFFLPWQQQGVEFLLQESPVPVAHSLCHAHAAQAPTTQRQGASTYAAQAQRPPQMQRPAPPTYQQRQEGVQQAPAYQRTAQNSTTQSHATQRQASPSGQNAQSRHGSQPWNTQGNQGSHENQRQTPQRAAHPAPAPQPQAPAQQSQQEKFHWPPHWAERLQLTKPGQVVWTYWELGNDLCGEASDARRGLLRKILTDLKHPPGTHTFWPVALPEQGSLAAHVPAFWTGADQLGARIIIILGDQATHTLGFETQNIPFSHMRRHGKLIILAKDMDTLIQNPSAYTNMMTYLRPFLTQFLHIS